MLAIIKGTQDSRLAQHLDAAAVSMPVLMPLLSLSLTAMCLAQLWVSLCATCVVSGSFALHLPQINFPGLAWGNGAQPGYLAGLRRWHMWRAVFDFTAKFQFLASYQCFTACFLHVLYPVTLWPACLLDDPDRGARCLLWRTTRQTVILWP